MCRHGSDSGGGAAGRPQTRASKRAADFDCSPSRGATGDGARPLVADWFLASERNRHVSMRPLLHYLPHLHAHVGNAYVPVHDEHCMINAHGIFIDQARPAASRPPCSTRITCAPFLALRSSWP